MIREAIGKVVVGEDLTEEEAAGSMREMMSEEATASQAAALLVALRIKGETIDEITGMVRVMREKVLRVEPGGDVLDIVSTGGGKFDPFNISTAASLVCAGAGTRVAKHGNRGFTSAAGAAEVMEALGAKLELTPQQSSLCIQQTGYGFLYAPTLHPAMRFVGPTRREIGVRTIFNSLGPLTNPAGSQFQLIGVSDPIMTQKVAAVMGRLGTGHSLIVHSDEGLDKVSLSAPTNIHDITGDSSRTYKLTAEDAGLPHIPLAEVTSGQKEENAVRVRAVLAGKTGPDRDYVLMNSGVGLFTANNASNVKEGVEMAREAIDSGAATRLLDAYVEATHSFED